MACDVCSFPWLETLLARGEEGDLKQRDRMDHKGHGKRDCLLTARIACF
jgi:hypothetical protein